MQTVHLRRREEQVSMGEVCIGGVNGQCECERNSSLCRLSTCGGVKNRSQWGEVCIGVNGQCEMGARQFATQTVHLQRRDHQV